jgi:hypothetical protein
MARFAEDGLRAHLERLKAQENGGHPFPRAEGDMRVVVHLGADRKGLQWLQRYSRGRTLDQAARSRFNHRAPKHRPDDWSWLAEHADEKGGVANRCSRPGWA